MFAKSALPVIPKQMNVHMGRAKLVCEIGFSNWTSDGIMRHRYSGGFVMTNRPGSCEGTIMLGKTEEIRSVNGKN